MKERLLLRLEQTPGSRIACLQIGSAAVDGSSVEPPLPEVLP